MAWPRLAVPGPESQKRAKRRHRKFWWLELQSGWHQENSATLRHGPVCFFRKVLFRRRGLSLETTGGRRQGNRRGRTRLKAPP